MEFIWAQIEAGNSGSFANETTWLDFPEQSHSTSSAGLRMFSGDYSSDFLKV